MNRLLLRSSRPSRLNNLKAAFLILPTLILFLFAIHRGVSTVHASSGTDLSDMYLNTLIFNVGSLNAQRTFPPKVVTLVTKNETVKKLVFGKTSNDIVRELGIQIDLDDMVLPHNEIVSDGGTVQVVKVDIVLVKKSEDLPYETKEVESESMDTGTLEVQQEGVMGIKEKTIKIIHQDGKVVKSEVISTDVILKPVEEILLVGVKPTTIASCSYWGDVVDRIATSDREKKWMKFVMFKESGCDSGRVSHGSGLYRGLFQFAPATYRGKGGVNIWDGTEQIKIVHEMFKAGSDYLSHQWPASHKAYLAKYGW